MSFGFLLGERSNRCLSVLDSPETTCDGDDRTLCLGCGKDADGTRCVRGTTLNLYGRDATGGTNRIRALREKIKLENLQHFNMQIKTYFGSWSKKKAMNLRVIVVKLGRKALHLTVCKANCLLKHSWTNMKDLN